MAKRVQFRRGTTAQHAIFIGAPGEITVDTDKRIVVVHDGVTPGGWPTNRLEDIDGNVNFSGIMSINSGVPSTSISTGSLVVNGGVGIAGRLNVTELTVNGTTTINEVSEVLTVINAYGTTQARPFSDGNVFLVNGLTGNYTFNWTGVPTVANRTFSLAHIIPQGATPRIPATLQINGTPVTLNWSGNVVPTGSANRINIISFLLWYTTNFTCVATLSSY
jgi:hypothetical protein